MGSWVSLPTDTLWRFALAAVPLVFVVAAITRYVPCRPATRHTLWLTVLLWMIAAPLLPTAPSLGLGRVAADGLGLEPSLVTEPVELPVPDIEQTADSEVRRADGAAAPGSVDPSTSSRWSVARPRLLGESRSPLSLARATRSGGSLTFSSEMPDRAFDSSPREANAGRSSDVDPADARVASDAPRPVPSAVSPQTAPVMAPPTAQTSQTWPTSEAVPPRVTLSAPPHVVAQESVAPVVGKDGAVAPVMVPAVPAAWRAWVAGLRAIQNAVLNLPSIPTTVWLGGAVLLGLLGTGRWFFSQRLLRAARPAPVAIRRAVRRAAKEMGLSRTPETLTIDRRISPMIWCGLRVRLVLPSQLWNELDEDGRRAVVFHELAHVRRRDHWVSWAGAIVGTLYWWYPLVWWVRSRIRAEAEDCCDAWVTTLLPRGRRAYAEALLKTKQYVCEEPRWMPMPGIGMTTGRAGRFSRRLTMVMTKSSKPRLSAPGIVLVLGVASTSWLVAPARSCPPKEKAVVVPGVSRVVDMAPVIAAASNDKPVGDCACGTSHHAGAVAAGAGSTVHHRGEARHVVEGIRFGKHAGPCAHCAGCANDEPCVSVGSASVAPKSSFRQYLAQKRQPSLYSNPALLGQLVGSMSYSPLVVATDDDDAGDNVALKRRLRKLERQLAKLGEQLERMNRAVGRAANRTGPHEPRRPRVRRRARPEPGPRVAPGPRRFFAPPPPPEPRGPRAPREAREHRRADAPVWARRGRDGRSAGVRSGPAPEVDDDGMIIRTYVLPEGKREALTELMVRSDVPVLVRPTANGIEVHGTAAEQRAFHAFVNIIHPDGEVSGERVRKIDKKKESKKKNKAKKHGRSKNRSRRRSEDGAPELARREAEAHEAFAAAMAEQTARTEAVRERYREVMAQGEAERRMVEAEADRMLAEHRARAEEEQHRAAAEMEERIQEARARAEENRTVAEADRHRAAAEMQERIQEAQEMAREHRVRAEEERQRAEAEMAEQIQEAKEEAAEAAHEQKVGMIEAEREAVQQMIAVIEQRSEVLSDQADEMGDQADELREQAEEFEDQAAEAREQAEGSEEETERNGLTAQAMELMQQAKILASQADGLVRQADQLRKQAESSVVGVGELEAKVSALEARLEAMHR